MFLRQRQRQFFFHFLKQVATSTAGSIKLGEGTATYDCEGEVVERSPWSHITGRTRSTRGKLLGVSKFS